MEEEGQPEDPREVRTPRQVDSQPLAVGNSTFTIDVPKATAGQWKYTFTPLKVPYENFPFTLTVGEKE